MKKKVLAVVLIVALALVSVSARSSKDAGFKAGLELGLGIDTFKTKVSGKVASSSGSTTGKFKNSGFALNLVGEYAFDKNWAVRLDAGLMFAGKATETSSSSDTKVEKGESSGVYMNYALDAKYTYAFNKYWSVAGYAGLEMAVGHIYKTGSEDVDKALNNVAFGLNFGGEVAYAINKSFSLVLGGDFGWFFVNANDTFKNDSSSLSISGTSYASSKVSNTSLSFRPYLGVQYAF